MMRLPAPLADQRGISLLVVLVMMVVVGLAAGVAGSTWQTIVQRARETELLWRGDQYRKAIQSYYGQGSGQVRQYPAKLEDLLKDPRSLATKRHLRRLYPDPMTGGDWALIKDAGGRVIGVHSTSTKKPFQQDGFPEEYENFAGANSYAAWEFVWKPVSTQQRAKTGATPAPGATP